MYEVHLTTVSRLGFDDGWETQLFQNHFGPKYSDVYYDRIVTKKFPNLAQAKEEISFQKRFNVVAERIKIETESDTSPLDWDYPDDRTLAQYFETHYTLDINIQDLIELDIEKELFANNSSLIYKPLISVEEPEKTIVIYFGYRVPLAFQINDWSPWHFSEKIQSLISKVRYEKIIYDSDPFHDIVWSNHGRQRSN